MSFAKVEREAAKLRQSLAAGQLTEEQVKARLRELMVEDADGAWWMVGYETSEWYRHDGADWTRADPPPPLSPGPSSPPVAGPPVSARPKRRWPWAIAVFGLSVVVSIIVGYVGAMTIAISIFEGKDNPFSWICLGLVCIAGAMIGLVLARSVWRGKQVQP